MTDDNECICWVPEQYWFSHYGATEPGSMKDFDPDCHACGPIYGKPENTP